MNPKGLVTSRIQINATHSASDFAGIAGDTGVYPLFPITTVDGSASTHDALGEEVLAERTRIAQELHDTLLQGFLAVYMQLHTAVDHLPSECETTKQRFGNVLKLLDRVLEQGRCVV